MALLRSNQPADRAAERAQAAMDSASERANQATERVQEGADYARGQSQDLLTTVTDYVQDHPMTALGIAVAAASILSALAARR